MNSYIYFSISHYTVWVSNMPFLSPPAKSFIISIWFKAWKRVPEWLKGCLVATERGFREKRWRQRGSSEAFGLWRLLVELEGEPLRQRLTQPGLGGHQPAEVGLAEFHLLLQDGSPQEIMEVAVCSREPGQAYPDGPSSGSSSWQGGFTASWVLPHSLEKLLHVLEEGSVATLVLRFWKTPGVLGFSWASWEKKSGPSLSRARLLWLKRKRRKRQVPTDACWTGGERQSPPRWVE